MKVYVVQRCLLYEGDYLIDICSSLKKAKAAAQNASNTKLTWEPWNRKDNFTKSTETDDWYNIEVWEVN